MGTKITASEERVFRLHSCSEDDTILMSKCIASSDVSPVPVGAGAGFLFCLFCEKVLALIQIIILFFLEEGSKPCHGSGIMVCF